jgi:hypothetical protein
MTRTAFIGAYGYGNLGDELCLIDAMQAFPSGEAFAYSRDPDWTMRCVPGIAGTFHTDQELMALRPARIVFGGGGIGTPKTFADRLPWLHAVHEACGAELHIHNIGIGGDFARDWQTDPVRAAFAACASFTVRDPGSVQIAMEVGIQRLPGLTRFPERKIEPDFALADLLLPKPGGGGERLLGISIINMGIMDRCLVQDRARVEALLAEFAGWTVVPVVSTIHRFSDTHDGEGLRRFLDVFLPRAKVVAPWLMERGPWHELLTPRLLKGLVARCDALVSQRKHNCIHGIGAGVRTIGLSPMIDDSLRRTFVTLSDELVPGSLCLGLDGPDLA